MATNSKSNKAKSAKPVVAAAKPAIKPAAKPIQASASRRPTDEEIGLRAFEIYVSEGCQPGNDLEHWLRAEAELSGKGGN
jgi:hypothetical protein